MRILTNLFVVVVSMLLLAGCAGNGNSKKGSGSGNDTITVPDTGFTGISQGMSGRFIVNEITYVNGVRNGMMKTFYVSGKVRQTFWYENGLRQDSSRWYFEEGQLFRTTPYKNDTIDGIQKQFYRTGRLKAKLGYIKGLRTPFLQEFTPEGKLVGGYPQIVVNIQDTYKSNGAYRITLELSDKSTKVSYYRGDLAGGVFDTAHCEKVNSINGIGQLNLKKAGTPQSETVGVIAEILTKFGNKYLEYKKIDLPYNDLN